MPIEPERLGAACIRSEVDLAKAAAAGDVAAFTALVRLHEAAVRRLLTRLLRGPGGDDLAQDVFLKAWRMAGSWRGDGTYKAWLMGIAWSVFLADYRARSRRAVREQTVRHHPPQVDANLSIDLARALADLDKSERGATLLCLGEGFSHAEAARVMDLPLGSLKSILARARSKLAARLELDHGR